MNGNRFTKRPDEFQYKKNISTTKKLTFSAIMCALGVVILFLGSIVEVMDISMAAIASFLIVVCMIETGGYLPFLVYLVTSTLAFLLLPNKTVVLIYVLFFGFYPILKNILERRNPLLCFILKFVIFNVIISLYYIMAKYVLLIQSEEFGIFMMILLNVVFFTFDLALTFFVTAYARRFRRLLQIHRFFK